ncbi:hypothetical protein K432DRAFT_383259 [Lepidopterella palustris CBS 459.81]|uniref:N-acetyltransferase domain-containing protein n=1 Tax=Lepidopterella palustris CBS 459.81 TaxID=1314670 RepID=A0A8E2JEN4_9PEZI|nr:hypothetical protein K432DRAFT_383259 [Lepidopterella palustris CBS 459.81]
MVQPSQISVRQGSLADLESMLEIGLAALPMDPQWNYRFPYRCIYPNETRKFTRLRFQEFLENKDGRWRVMLAEGEDAQGPIQTRLMAFAVWEIFNWRTLRSEQKVTRRSSRRPHHRLFRRDGDPRRMQAWSDILSSSKRHLFDKYYGTGHFQLQILATHPSFQRRGAGTALCQWGMQIAERMKMAISVFASPMGYRLYSHLGFDYLASVTVKVQEEEESVTLEAMAYLPNNT